MILNIKKDTKKLEAMPPVRKKTVSNPLHHLALKTKRDPCWTSATPGQELKNMIVKED